MTSQVVIFSIFFLKSAQKKYSEIKMTNCKPSCVQQIFVSLESGQSSVTLTLTVQKTYQNNVTCMKFSFLKKKVGYKSIAQDAQTTAYLLLELVVPGLEFLHDVVRSVRGAPRGWHWSPLSITHLLLCQLFLPNSSVQRDISKQMNIDQCTQYHACISLCTWYDSIMQNPAFSTCLADTNIKDLLSLPFFS